MSGVRENSDDGAGNIASDGVLYTRGLLSALIGSVVKRSRLSGLIYLDYEEATEDI